MKTLPAPISDAERAVSHFKRPLLVRVMAEIIAVGKRKRYFGAGDVREDIVAAEHRQGVASNAWNALKALEIIEQLPLHVTVEAEGIYGGRMMNKNEGAKGRWVCAYRLINAAKADTWLACNRALLPLPAEVMAQPLPVQKELL